jgi:hypothetical protein
MMLMPSFFVFFLTHFLSCGWLPQEFAVVPSVSTVSSELDVPTLLGYGSFSAVALGSW